MFLHLLDYLVSISLLYCLNKFKTIFDYKIVCAHINHLIRKDSTDDEKFVENECKKLNIPFFKKREDIEALSKKLKKDKTKKSKI